MKVVSLSLKGATTAASRPRKSPLLERHLQEGATNRKVLLGQEEKSRSKEHGAVLPIYMAASTSMSFSPSRVQENRGDRQAPLPCKKQFQQQKQRNNVPSGRK